MPTLTRPNSGIRNQKNGSEVPSNKSFTEKSIPPSIMLEEVVSHFWVQGPLLAFDTATHRNVSAVNIVGRDVLKH